MTLRKRGAGTAVHYYTCWNNAIDLEGLWNFFIPESRIQDDMIYHPFELEQVELIMLILLPKM